MKIHAYRAHLPWRDDRLTECGRLANDQTVDFAGLLALEIAYRAEHAGSRPYRDGSPVCSVCLDRGRVHPRSYGDNPTAVMKREIQGEQDPAGRLVPELLAVAQLIAAHRDEFDTLAMRERMLVALREPSRRSA